ncbi:cupin domain-containing protein [Amycolatopsis sp. H20-H5]|uniref:cupin domain-containing protein n=1 Tax=Amycolatopsis sp. H20-H5 TaxID=3046309 RepID=UPI002DB921A2|nr:cupin domain-containing protein [Amycolatopsis sp. H20-H5]MEC3974250.1 cupin domain-containing protein [Amycolatopsis sp. H20-H5]
MATIAPGDYISSHLHPYSEEFVFLVRGELRCDLGDEAVELTAGQGLLVPKETPHRLVNTGTVEAFLVFHLGPLAPRPELGHVDLEEHMDQRVRS